MDPIIARTIATSIWYEHEHGPDRPAGRPVRPQLAHVLRRWADAVERPRATPVAG
jgi:hypothetical protein